MGPYLVRVPRTRESRRYAAATLTAGRVKPSRHHDVRDHAPITVGRIDDLDLTDDLCAERFFEGVDVHLGGGH